MYIVRYLCKSEQVRKYDVFKKDYKTNSLFEIDIHS